MSLQRDLVDHALGLVEAWQSLAGTEPEESSSNEDTAGEPARDALTALARRLQDNYPFQHSRYAGQMLKPPHPVALAAYAATMAINPNNHALDGGPATAAMEKEVIEQLARMVGFGPAAEHLGHLTSSGTIANLEALFVARESHPGKAIAYGTNAHYTHSRMCHVLGVRGVSVPADADGRLDLDAAETTLSRGDVGTIVVTLGTTGVGAVDPLHEIVPIAKRHGVRIHVDAAYGGFFALLATGEPFVNGGVDPRPWQAIRHADSIVIDPHKHGLQPYGCGSVLFADPSVGRFFVHDSPYTYFTSDELHLGEISLECSRAGASAAALWTTLRLLPLTRDGLGETVAAGRRAAIAWQARLSESHVLASHLHPDTDIVTYLPRRATSSEVDRVARDILRRGMTDSDPVFVATLNLAPAELIRHEWLTVDGDATAILRSVLMKPSHESAVPWLHEKLEMLASTS